MPEPWAAREMAGAALPHERFRTSLIGITEHIASSGGSSFSAACGHGGRQAARRLCRNSRTTPEGLMTGHGQQTAARCAGHSLVLCIQDSTTLDYTTHRSKKGIGPVSVQAWSRGLMAHSVLALSTDGLPLGVLHTDIWAREDCATPKKQTRRKRQTPEKESNKWLLGLRAVTKALPASQRVLMIQDREADVFDLLAEPRRSQIHLLIRACQPRRVELDSMDADDVGTPTTLMAAIEASPASGEMLASVPRKPGQPERQARLQLQYRSMRVLPPIDRAGRGSRAAQPVTVIRAAEIGAPEGVEPIRWVLLCTMPVSSPADAQQMVRFYARRWMIERLHFTLKSGCFNVERLQIDDAAPLKNALAIYYIAAWRVLHLTHLARTTPDEPADTVLSGTELTVLRAAAKRPVHCIADAFREIACLAGHEHYANAPPPGVKRIWQGLRILESLTAGWHLAINVSNK